MSSGDQNRIAPHPVLQDYYSKEEERRKRVDNMFDSSAEHYDWVTDVMSFGSGRWYRRQALQRAGLTSGDKGESELKFLSKQASPEDAAVWQLLRTFRSCGDYPSSHYPSSDYPSSACFNSSGDRSHHSALWRMSRSRSAFFSACGSSSSKNRRLIA